MNKKTEESEFLDALIDFLLAALSLTKKHIRLSRAAEGGEDDG